MTELAWFVLALVIIIPILETLFPSDRPSEEPELDL